MDNADRLSEFLDCENNRDWAKCESYLAENVVWELDEKETIVGKPAYMAHIAAAYEGSDETFYCRHMYATDSRIVAVLVNSRGTSSVCIFDFEGDLIAQISEYPS